MGGARLGNRSRPGAARQRGIARGVLSRSVGTLCATLRDASETGSRKSRAKRRKGLIPGVIYGNDAWGIDEPILIQMDATDVHNAVKRYGTRLENTLFDVEVDGKVHRVLPRQLQEHPSE